ncbi:radical SAM protein [Streptomyces sp. NBC_00637]|uniref:radical SAM protein n=1 Tax=Streptomyces sp. NBC_00637 TaxID=2903667 RepID=UPI00324705D4
MSTAAQAIRRQRHDAADRPFIVIWESTRACPLACLHCRAEAVPGRDPRELDTAAAKDPLDQVAAFGQPAPLFVITGGDPFQRPDLTELIAYGQEIGVRVAVSPSGTPTLTAERLREVHAAGAVGLSLSLDGSTAEIHDTFRGVPGVFRWTLEAWDAARAMGMKVQINTTVTRHNLHDLPDIVRLVAEHGAMLWSAFFLVPTGRGRQLGVPPPPRRRTCSTSSTTWARPCPPRPPRPTTFAASPCNVRSSPPPATTTWRCSDSAPSTGSCASRPPNWAWTPERAGYGDRRWTSTPAAASSSSPTPAPCTRAASCR